MRAGVTPSLQTESELWTKKGPSPKSGNAFFTPPPVSSRRSRSSEMTISGSLREPKMGLDLIGEVMHVDDRLLHVRRFEPVEHMVDQRAAGKRHHRLSESCP